MAGGIVPGSWTPQHKTTSHRLPSQESWFLGQNCSFPDLNILLPMASAKSPVYPQEYMAFDNALRKVLQVSHSEIKARMEAEKKAKASKPRPSSRVRDSRGNG
jgi:hypothetical protein